MNLDCAVYSVEPVRDMLPRLFECVDRLIPVRDSRYQLFLTMNGTASFDVARIVEAAAASRDDHLLMEVPQRGNFTVSWANGVYQLIGLEVRVATGELPLVLETFRSLVHLTDARYAHVDLENASPVLPIEEKSGATKHSPVGCLRDLYWYNYFGSELTQMLTTDHSLDFDVAGLHVARSGSTMEVVVESGPQARPFTHQIEEYLERARVFLRLNPKARFVRVPITFDYTKLRY